MDEPGETRDCRLGLACGVVSLGACTMGTVRSPIYGGGWMSDYGQTRPYYGQPYEYRDPYGYPRPYGPPGMGSAHTGMRHSRGSSPRSWRVVRQAESGLLQMAQRLGGVAAGPIRYQDNFGKKAARRLKQ